LQELRGHRCLRYAQASAEDEWGTAEADAAPGLVSNDGEVLLSAAVAGLGLAVLPERLAHADLAAGRLVLVMERRLPPLGIFAVYPNRQLPQRLRRFLDFLAARLGKG
jgi:DNA-binding transcriptional LysR family regulator